MQTESDLTMITTSTVVMSDVEKRSQEGLFGKIFPVMVALQNEWPEKIVTASVIIDSLQIIGFMINPQIDWGESAGILPKMIYVSHFPLFDDNFVQIKYLDYCAFFWAFAGVFSIGTVVVVTSLSKKAHKNLVSIMRGCVSSVVSWLMIPLLHCTAAVMVCGDNGKLWMFSDEPDCWSSGHLAHFIGAIIVLSCFLPVCYILKVSLYEDLSPYFYSKAHSHADSFAMWVHFASVFVFHILLSRRYVATYCFVIAGMTLPMAGLYGFMLPYYRIQCNSLKVSQYGTCGLLALVRGCYEVANVGQHSDSLTVLLIGGLPICGLVSYLLSTQRVEEVAITSMEDQRGGDLSIEIPPEQRCTPKVSTFPRGLPACDQVFTAMLYNGSAGGVLTQAYNKQSSVYLPTESVVCVPYIKSVHLSTDVELAGRCLPELFLQGIPADFYHINYVARIYSKGLLAFKKDVAVKLNYTWFLLVVALRPQMAYAFLVKNEEVGRIFLHRSSINAEYNAHKLIERLRRNLRIKERHHQIFGKQAIKVHEEALSQMHQFWLRLMELSVDMIQVSQLASSIAENRENGTVLFKKALSGDIGIMKVFADFLEDVVLNVDAARFCREEVAELEAEKKSIKMGGSRKGAAQTSESVVIQRLLENLTKRDTFGASNSTVKKLAFNLNLVFLLLALLVAGNMILETHFVATQTDVIRKLNLAGEARMLTQRAAYEVQEFVKILSDTSDFSQKEKILLENRERIVRIGNRFTAAHNELMYGKYRSGHTDHLTYLEEPLHIVTTYQNAEPVDTIVAFWELGNLLSSALAGIELNLTDSVIHSLVASEVTYQGIRSSSDSVGKTVIEQIKNNGHIKFVLANAPHRISEAFNMSMNYYEEESDLVLEASTRTLVGLFVTSVAVIAMIYLLFIWNFKKITISKMVTLQLFTLIPYDTLERMSQIAKEKVMAIRVRKDESDHRRKRVRGNDPTISEKVLHQMERVRAGLPIEDEVPISALEKTYNARISCGLRNDALTIQLKEFINQVQRHTAVVLDPDTIAFVQEHILDVYVPPSILCEGHQWRGNDATESEATGSEQARAVQFAGKEILGSADQNEEEEVAEEIQPEEVKEKSKQQQSSSKTDEGIPAEFWFVNILLIISMGVICFACSEIVSQTSNLGGPYKEMKDLRFAASRLREATTETVEAARLYAQFGDLRGYIKAMDHISHQTLKQLEYELVRETAAGSEVMQLIMSSKERQRKVDHSLLQALSLATRAFGQESILTETIRDATWPTPDEFLYAEADPTTILFYQSEISKTSYTYYSSDEMHSLTISQVREQAQRLLFTDIFRENYEKVLKTFDDVKDFATLKDSFSETYVSLNVAACIVAVLMSARMIYSLSLNANLSQYYSMRYGFGVITLLLVVNVFFLVSFLTDIREFDIQRETAFDYLKFSDVLITESSKLVRSTQLYTVDPSPSRLNAYVKDLETDFLGDMDRQFAHYEYEGTSVEHEQVKQELLKYWEKMRSMEAIALVLATSDRDTGFTEQAKSFLRYSTWNFSTEEAHLATMFLAPICDERVYDCRTYIYTDRPHDMMNSSENRGNIAREMAFTVPYLEMFYQFNKVYQKRIDDMLHIIEARMADVEDTVKSEVLSVSVLGYACCVLTFIGVTSLLVHALIELAEKKQKHQTDNPLFRSLLFRCQVSLVVIATLICAIFGLGIYSVEMTSDEASGLNLASTREWLVARAMVFSHDLASGTSILSGVAYSALKESVDIITRNVNQLHFGSVDTPDYSSIKATSKQNYLTFGGDDFDQNYQVLQTYYSDKCGNSPPSPLESPIYSIAINLGTMPLDLQLRVWLDDVRELLSHAEECYHTCSPLATTLERLRATVTPLVETLTQSSDLYEGSATDSIDYNSAISKAVFIVTFLTLIQLYNLVFRKMLSSLSQEESGTKGMLKMIPQDVMESVPAISEYLETGRVDNTEQLQKNFEQSEKLLANILPENVSRRLKSGENPIADMHNSVTILFTDFVGFTSISSQLNAVEIVSFLNEVFIEFDNIGELLEIEKIKTIGDAYFMAGGLDHTITDHAHRVVEAGLQMFRALSEHNERHPDRKELQMRLGCHTGPAVAGCIGVKKVAYDLWGESVTIAEDMESGGVPGRVHISPTTTELVEDTYIIQPRGVSKLKIPTFLVAGRKVPSPYMHMLRKNYARPTTMEPGGD
eukprot:TRINITY_DN15323_c0_g1_i1.p1 TRINITY_DN15323_c0_g1~~TRINITY_DN15323_c0_g1_i1.p1  ORF type:complete len:2209 (+),score=421.25 TRINITY_DN15323_c0_g1_i1:53-6628(+)